MPRAEAPGTIADVPCPCIEVFAMSQPHEGETIPASPASSSNDLPAGLPERYQLRGRVGQGGMGEVLSGRDAELGRDLALKLLRAERGENPEAVERFREEARIGGQLQPPGIVQFYDLGALGDGDNRGLTAAVRRSSNRATPGRGALFRHELLLRGGALRSANTWNSALLRPAQRRLHIR